MGEQQREGHHVDAGLVVVRRAGSWHLTPVGAFDDQVVDLAAVLATLDDAAVGDAASPSRRRLVELAEAAAERVAPSGAALLDGVKAVRPISSFASAVVPGGLLTHGATGWMVLDRTDLVLLDLVAGRTPLRSLLAAAADRLGDEHGDADLRARLARLADAHRLVVRRPGATADAKPFGTHIATSYTRPQARVADEPVVAGGAAGRIPVWAPWDEADLPLGLAMVTAAARGDEQVAARYDVRPPQRSADVLAELSAHDGPKVLLCSNYLWTVDALRGFAAAAKQADPDLLVVHGGPATPKYEADVEAFFAEGGAAVDVAIRGEGEAAIVEALRAIEVGPAGFELAGLADVAGLAFRDGATVVRTDDRERIAELDALPSPYLSGDFEHLEGNAGTIETNRGCPYGCTFCDWGSATLSRVRKFDLDRVEAEMRWLAARHIDDWTIGDANFGIFPRDVEVVERLVQVKQETGYPERLAFCLAKNTTRHLVQIVDLLTEHGVAGHCSLSLQTRDPDTLAAVDRRNIKTEHYTELANAFRRKRLPLMADLMLGLPGQTVDSYRLDLQFLFDLEVVARTWPTQVLPNAPLNAPEYRAEHEVVVDDRGLLVSTSSYTAADRDAMRRLRQANAAFEHFGLLRHVLRVLQWDHGVAATEVMARAVEVTDADPGRYPLLSWVLHWFDVHTVPPVGWPAFYAEVADFVRDELGVQGGSGLDAVLQAQQHLMPAVGRTFPDAVELQHDLVGYTADATRWFWDEQATPGPPRPLDAYGPATLEVWDDPSGFCGPGLGSLLGSRSETHISRFWLSDHWELDSPLTRAHPEVARDLRYQAVRDLRAGADRRPRLEVRAEPA